VIQAMEEFCVGQTNEIYERYTFNKQDQEPNERIDAYAAVLLTFAKTCKYQSLIRDRMIDWLIDYLMLYVPLKNFSLIWRRHHCRWRPAKFTGRPMFGAQGLWAGRDLYRATPAVTHDLGFSGLIRRTVPFSRLLRHTKGCGESILTRILTGLDRMVLLVRDNNIRRKLLQEKKKMDLQKCIVISKWKTLLCQFWAHKGHM
jgi:hypothetical protein